MSDNHIEILKDIFTRPPSRCECRVCLGTLQSVFYGCLRFGNFDDGTRINGI